MSSKQTGKEIGDISQFSQFAKFGGVKAAAPAPAPTTPDQDTEDETQPKKLTTRDTHFRQTVYMPKELNQRLKMQAVREHDDVSGIINRLVTDYLSRVEP